MTRRFPAPLMLRTAPLMVSTLLAVSQPLVVQRPTSMAGRSTVYAPNAAIATSHDRDRGFAAESDPRKDALAIGY